MGDARGWSREAYKNAILMERRVKTRIVFALQFAPSEGTTPEMVATATSDGAVALHSLAHHVIKEETSGSAVAPPAPVASLSGHIGPAYDLLSFGREGSEMLASCGDDGRTLIWRWRDVLNFIDSEMAIGNKAEPSATFTNPQKSGAHGSLAQMPETNAIAVDMEAGIIYSASGDGCGYGWDLETGKSVAVFRGHSDYLHCIASRPSHKQVLTGSEDGTVRIWDCRSGSCTAILDPFNAVRLKRQPREDLPWVSCMSVDDSENWMVCGSGANTVTLWNLPMTTAATRITMRAAPQDVILATDQIVVVGVQPHVSRFGFGGNVVSQVACAPVSAFTVDVHRSGVTAVGGYGGLVDIMSNFGSHLCTFCC